MGVAAAAEHLNGHAVCVDTELRRPGLRNGGQQGEEHIQLVRILGAFILRDLVLVHQHGAEQDQVHGPFDVRLLGQEHSADIGVLDDHDLGLGLVPFPGLEALGSLFSVRGAVAKPCIRNGHGRHPGADTQFIHHVEHRLESRMGNPDEVAQAGSRLTELDHAIDAAAIAHLVVQTDQLHVIALAI